MKEIKKIKFIPQIPKRKKVAAYCRVSTGKDAMLHSLATQVNFYRNYIQSNGEWEFAGVFYDEALSGTKADRTGFQSMMAECKNGSIDLIITKSISRFARNTVTLLDSVHQLKEIGVSVYFEEQNIYSDSPDGELMLSLLAAFAQEESLSASENQKWRIKKAFENGELITLRVLYGYTIDKGNIKINSETAKIVKQIFELFVDGYSMFYISKQLNKKGVKSTYGGAFTPNQIRNILTNEKYTGNSLLMKSFRNNHLEKKKVKNNGEKDMFYAEETHPAIISQELFEKAKERLQEISVPTIKPKQNNPLSGVIKCGNCGKNYLRKKNNGTVFWNCNAYINKGKSVCPGSRLREDTLIELLSDVDINEVTTIYVKGNSLIIIYSDGSQEQKKYEPKSRADSWTSDMREKARKRKLERQETENG